MEWDKRFPPAPNPLPPLEDFVVEEFKDPPLEPPAKSLRETLEELWAEYQAFISKDKP